MMRHATDDEPTPKFHGPLRRNWKLLLALVAVVLAGPLVTRLLDGYRAIVLERADTRAYLFWEQRPPRWVSNVEAPAGTLLLKERGDWSPHATPSIAADAPLEKAYGRYQQAYRGTVTELRPPAYSKGPSIAVIAVDGGGTLELPVWSHALADIRVGSRVRKAAGTWDPVLVDPSEESGAELGAVPDEAHP